MVATGGGGTGAGSSFLAPQVQPNVLSLPPRWRSSQAAAAGLSNLGNSCYLNSTLQCLAFVPPLGHLCLTHGHSSTCARTRSGAGGGFGGSSSYGGGGLSTSSSTSSLGGAGAGVGGGGSSCCTFCLIERQLCAMLRAPRGGTVSPGEVVRGLHLFGRAFVKGRQEDSHEFLTALLDVMERDGRRAATALGAPKNVRTIVEDLFVGRWQSQVRCLACGHESNTYEPFATLPLDIAQARSVVDGLRAFTEAERLDGANKYRCDRCRQLVPAVKQTTIWDDPNVLVVHMKRFDGGCLLGGKVMRHVGFGDTLDLGRFMTLQQQQQQQGPTPATSSNGGAAASSTGHHHHHHQHQHQHQHHGSHHSHHSHHQHQHQHQNGGQQQQHHQHDPGRSLYTLTGVLVHQGSSLHSGHYYAFVRDSADRWALMNDSSVTPVSSFAEVAREQAYMLFYTRQTMKRPREPPTPPPPAPPEAAAAAGGGSQPAAPAMPAAGAKAAVYGPQLPPGFARAASAPMVVVPASAAAAANGGGGSAASSAVSSGDLGGGGGAAAEGLLLGRHPAVPTARLAARPAQAPSTAKLPAKFTITPRASLDRPAAAAAAAAATAAPRGTRSAPPTPSASTAAAAGSELTASTSAATASEAAAGAAGADADAPLSGRKRKQPEPSGEVSGAAGAASGSTTATAAERRRAAVEAEVAAHKACASWGEGVKRLKGAVSGMLRGSEWMGQVAAVLRSLKRSGLSLQEVVALPHTDERRQRLNRAVPHEVLKHGRDELARLLRALLVQLGWLGAAGSLLPALL